jgi:hypothetical protein
MRKAVFCSVIVGFLLLTAPVFAEIQGELETPENGQEVDGKSLFSGWTYSDLDPNAAITVTLLINGNETTDTIPCCASRLDVQTEHPGAPLNTGFARLQNYGIFNPATLTSIGVKITIQGEPQPKIINHQVIVVKPGARSSDADLTLFSFLQQLSTSGARAALDDEELIVAPVTVTDSGLGGTRKSTLRLLWTSNSQTFGIIAAASGTSFDAVQTIFNNSCATAQCHDHTSAAGMLDLSEGRAFRRTVAVGSNQDSNGRFRVNPGKASASYLYQKIIPDGASIEGMKMPPVCDSNPGECLSADDIQTIAGWIDEGAPPPQQ